MKIVLGAWLYLSLKEMDPASSTSLERSGSDSCLVGPSRRGEGGPYARYQNLKINTP